MTVPVDYEEFAERLTPEARSFFREMVGAHLATSGDRTFIRSDSKDGTCMIFTGGPKPRPYWERFDGGAFEDLIDLGLLRQKFSDHGRPYHRITPEGLHFHQWLLERQGGAIAQVEDTVQRTLSSEAFARAHPGAAHHLSEAFALLWGGSSDQSAISEIGDHLRKAVMDTTTDVLGSDGKDQERPAKRLSAWLRASPSLHSREEEVLTKLVELVDAILKLDQRLNHVRDEVGQGQREVTWEEVCRAAFTTAFVCYELDRARGAG